MAFSGKATYTDYDSIHEDVSDIVSINAFRQTPLLDALGDPQRPAISVQHDWLEDALVSKEGQLNEAMDATETAMDVDDGTKYAVDDYVRVLDEIMKVTAITTNTLTVVRGACGTTAAIAADNSTVYILGNAPEEGADAGTAKATNRSRVANYVQLVRSRVIQVSNTENRVSQIGGDAEYEHQKAQRVVEVMRDLESFVINGGAHASTPRGVSGTARTMKGINAFLSTNVSDLSAADITEAVFMDKLNAAWTAGAQDMDLIVCGAHNRALLSRFSMFNGTSNTTAPTSGSSYNMNPVQTLETQYGTLRLLPPSRWIMPDEILILSSRYVSVLPLQNGGSFHHLDIAAAGSYKKGYVEGEYTCECRHEAAHVRVYNTSIA